MKLPQGIDFTDASFYQDGIPHELFAELRREAPVWWNAQEPGVAGFDDEGYWVVSTHELVQQVSRDDKTYSSWQNTATARYPDNIPRPYIDANRTLLLNKDAPEHTALRRIISRGFTPRAIGGLRNALSERADVIIDQALEAGRGNFVEQVAAELPLQAISDMVGIPQGDRHKIFDWSNIMTGRDDPAITEDPAVAVAEVLKYSNELAADRRKCPADDIATLLVQAQEQDSALTDEEFGYFVVLLMVAGSETTRNAITHGLMAFQDNPDEWQKYCQERPSTAVDEIIRWASPVMSFQRTATVDTTLGNQKIRKGDRVLMLYASANYDEKVFTDPHKFNISRSPNPHLSFGGTGAHYCIGANLARMEVELIYESLANKIPDITTVGPAQRLQSGWLNSIKELPVQYQQCPVTTKL